MMAVQRREAPRRLSAVLWAALVVAYMAAGALGAAGPQFTDPDSLRDAAIQDAASSLVKALPPSGTPGPVGLVPLKGDDDGRVTNALATALSEAHRYDLTQLPSMGPQPTPKQLGAAARKAGVGAVLVGEVLENRATTGSARVLVTARLLRGQDGKELWSGKGEGERKSALGAVLSIETIVERTLDQEGLKAAAQEKACQRLVASFGSALPKRVGVAPVIGDTDGQLGRRLVSAASKQAEVVMLKLQSPTLDSLEAARLGRQARVDAVVLAQIEGSKDLLGRAEVTLHGRLVRSRDGVILKAATFRQIYQSHVGRYRWVLLAAIAVVVLLVGVIVGPRIARRMRRAIPGQAKALRERELSTDQRLRERVSREITACLDLLKDMGERAVAGGETGRHALVQQVRRDLDVFRLEVENAPYGHHPELVRAGVNERDLQRLAEIEQRVLGMLEGVHEELRRLAESKPDARPDERLEAMRRQVQDMTTRFGERKSVLSGIGR